jgi:DNA helicase HerA-like ATPase
MNPLETIFVNIWNRTSQAQKPTLDGGLPLGQMVFEGEVRNKLYYLPTAARPQHIVIQGKSGNGKSFFIRHIAQHDIEAGRGFVLFDLHGDLLVPLLCFLAVLGVDASRLILIDPASPEWAVGLNPLEAADDQSRFLQVAELTHALADRWDFRGARTEELLRNTLFVLSANSLTILEAALLLGHDEYRAELLKNVRNQDVREYFELRYDPQSEAMKAAMREPVLNKLSELTADPHFRYILGQRESTISFDDALRHGKIVLVNLNKGALGVHALTFGSLVLAKLKIAIFRRQKRSLYSVFADEMQNLVSADTDFESLFAESRKFGVSIVTANQFGAQLPQKMRSAVQAVGTRIFFQISPEDANQVAQEIDGGRSMTEQLRNLPSRHFVIKSGNHKAYEVRTLDVETSKPPIGELVAQSNALYAKRRSEIDKDILARRPKPAALKEVLNDWE